MNLIEPALFELFREEAKAHSAALASGLLELETDSANPTRVPASAASAAGARQTLSGLACTNANGP